METLEQLNNETIELTKQAFAAGPQNMNKAGITVGNVNLQGYNLEAPSKKLYPVLSPLRNRIARKTAPVGSVAAHWKAITGINTLNVKAAVAFGSRNASSISYAEKDLTATYKSFGLDDVVDDEAVWLGRGFEDVRALSALATLQSTMIEEEKLILGGVNTANTLGTPATPTSAAAGATGTWTATTAYIKVVALPTYGYLNSDLTGLLSLGDASALSAARTQAVTPTQTLTAQVTPVNGAVAYAWFVGSGAVDPGDAARFLQQITTIPALTMTANPVTNTMVATGVVDTSGDANAFDGLLPQILNVNSTMTTLDATGGGGAGVLKKVTGPATVVTGAIVYDMNVATGASQALTSDGSGGIKEFDSVLKALWDQNRIGPTLAILNSQEALNITRKIAANATGLQYRVPVNDGAKDITGGIFVSGYLNKFTSSQTPGSPDVIPFLIHPYLAPGTTVFISERLPYPNNQIANVLEMEMQQEYADFEWARTTRQYQHGVYAMGVLKHYFPAGCAIVRSIANG